MSWTAARDDHQTSCRQEDWHGEATPGGARELGSPGGTALGHGVISTEIESERRSALLAMTVAMT